MIQRQGLVVAGVELAVGLGAALVGERSLGELLYGLTPSDPLTLTAVAALLLTTAAAASIIPARRATRVDPQLVLRSE